MKKYRWTIILIVVLAIIAAILITTNRKDTFHQDENSFAVEDTTTITRLFFADKYNNTSLLEKQLDGSWILNGKYLVNRPVIRTMIYTLATIQANQTVPKAARENIIRLIATRGIKVEVYQRVYRIDLFGRIKLFPHEKKTKVYYVGDATMDNRGTYMLMEDAQNPYIVFIPGLRGFVASRYTAKENDWRDHGMIDLKLPQIKEISIKFPQNKGYSFILQNNDNRNFVLTDMESGSKITDYDTLRVIEYLGSFKRLNYEAIQEVLSKARMDSLMAATPFCELKVTDKEGKVKEFTMWKRKMEAGELDIEGNEVEFDPENLFALEKGSNEYLLIQYFVFDKVFRPLPWFLKYPQTVKK